MKAYSIRRRIIVTVLLIELASAICVSMVAYVYERQAHFRSFDILLHGRAAALLGAVQDSEDNSDSLMLDGSEASLPEEDIYEVRDADHRLLGRSQAADELEGFFPVGRGSRRHWEDNRQDDSDQAVFALADIHDRTFRMIRITGTRVVDPGDKQGGVKREVTVYYGAPALRVWHAIYRVVEFYALSSLLVLAVTGMILAWLLNRSLAPLRELASGAATISVSSWTFHPSEEARKIAELAPLVTALESVLSGLQQAFEKQQRFVGDAAHELKTNVALVKSSLQLLGMRQRAPREYQAGIERCLTDCLRMEETVAQMLTLAQIEEEPAKSGTLFKTDLLQSLFDAAETVRTMAESRNIPVVIKGQASLFVDIETEPLKLLYINLLINALQHSQPGSAVRAEVSQANAMARIHIADEGDGIDPLDLPLIFERFSRGDPSRSRKTGGTGLGLAIVKAIVDKYRGAIHIESQISAGTQVTVEFPLTPDPIDSALE